MHLILTTSYPLSLPPQDEQKCVETVELDSYEKCQDLRALLKRKHRFILLRSPGNKVGLCLLWPDLPPGWGLLWRITPGGSLRLAELLDAAYTFSVECSLRLKPRAAAG